MSHLKKYSKFAKLNPLLFKWKLIPTILKTNLERGLRRIIFYIQAWYPLGHGDNTLIEEPIFTELAKKYGKSNAQIILRWHVQSENIVIPGSKNPQHIKDNIAVFDFELTANEMSKISNINKNKRYYVPNPKLTASYAKMELSPELDV